MSPAHWSATVVDAPESEPFTTLGDLVVTVRTPRSRDFVTVEVFSTAHATTSVRRASGVLLTAKPSPAWPDQWHGEVQPGRPVQFNVDGSHYRLTLARYAAHAAGLPWVTCEFTLERD